MNESAFKTLFIAVDARSMCRAVHYINTLVRTRSRHDGSMTNACFLRSSQLILEVVGQLQRMFNPDLRMIKKRIEDLIGREYIERDPVRSGSIAWSCPGDWCCALSSGCRRPACSSAQG